MTFGSPLETQKAYAEKPFDFWYFKRAQNKQFTIEEDIKIGGRIRSKKEMTRYGEKEYGYIKVSDGIFVKDLKVSESEWMSLCVKLPKTLISLKGVTMAFNGEYIEFVSAEMPPVNGNGNGASQQPTAAPQQPSKDMTLRQFAEALLMDEKLGRTRDIKSVMAIAETLNPGDALGLIKAAKDGGYIIEDKGAYRGVV